MTVGFNTVYKKTCPTVFEVINIAPKGKRIKVFNYPIENGMVRDLMAIPFVSEADIRHSLLKGELFRKIITGEIRVVDSNIDLLQFDPCHLDFLRDAGVIKGLTAGSDGYGGNVNYLWKQEIPLIGIKNGTNRVFTVMPGDKFIDGLFDDNEFHIHVDHNGRRLIQDIDFQILESGGVGTGYDTIRFISFAPTPKSQLIADYVIQNPNS